MYFLIILQRKVLYLIFLRQACSSKDNNNIFIGMIGCPDIVSLIMPFYQDINSYGILVAPNLHII